MKVFEVNQRGMKSLDSGENCVMRNSIISILHWILIRLLNQGGWWWRLQPRRQISNVHTECRWMDMSKLWCHRHVWLLTSATGIGVEWQLSSLIPSKTCAICSTYFFIYCHKNGQSSGLSPYLSKITYTVKPLHKKIARDMNMFSFQIGFNLTRVVIYR